MKVLCFDTLYKCSFLRGLQVNITFSDLAAKIAKSGHLVPEFMWH